MSYTWISPKDTLLNKTSPQFSFSKSVGKFDDHYDKQMKKVAAMPGPGHYSSNMELVDSPEPVRRGGSVRFSIIDNPEMLNAEKSVGFDSKRSQSFAR